MRWIWVSLPYATYGIAVRDGRVVDAAPIAAWMIGRDEREIAAWLRRKGARVVPTRLIELVDEFFDFALVSRAFCVA